jgi:hypothetical protein
MKADESGGVRKSTPTYGYYGSLYVFNSRRNHSLDREQREIILLTIRIDQGMNCSPRLRWLR